MRTPLISFTLLLMSLSPCTNADAFYEVIHFKCEPKANFVQVELLGAYNEEGERIVKNKGANSWRPWELVEDGGTGRYIKKLRTIQKSCVLSDGTYLVEIEPNPCNYDTQGASGAMMMTRVKITKNGKLLAREDFGACSVVDVRVTTKLQIRPGQKPIVERKSGDDYYK